MTSTPTYPEDIMKAATEIVDRIEKVHIWKGDCVADVAAALQARDERAAKICERISADDREESKLKADEHQYQSANHWNAHADGCDECAAAIRNQGDQP